MRAALVGTSGRVENMIELDENSDYKPERGVTLIILDAGETASIGDTWGNGTWTPPVVPAEPTTPTPSVEEQLAEIRAAVDMLMIQSLEG